MHNLITDIKICSESVSQMMDGNVSLLYYAHIPTIVISFLMGLFIFIKSSKSLEAKIFFVFSSVFSFWAFLNFLAWTSSDSRVIMFAWSLLGLLSVLFYVLSLYFSYAFLDKKDISFTKKMILGLLVLPVIIFTPTVANLKGFYLDDCSAKDNLFFGYVYVPQIIISFWIMGLMFNRFRRANEELRGQILILASGITFFLLTFFVFGYVADNYGIYKLEIYGLFAQLLFVGVLAYLIVKYNAFNIRILSVQALVFALLILIASQFAFIRNNINRTLTAFTLVLASGFGWFIIASVKKEIKQREDLEFANAEIERHNKSLILANEEIRKRKDQLQRISDSLSVANEKLQKLDIAKTDFISMASHQLRTPPTPIKGYSSMLLEGAYGELSPEQKKAVENIAMANNQQIAFVEDLLNVSRMETGKIRMDFKKWKVEELCQGVASNLIFKAQDKKLYLDYKASVPALPEVMIDGSKIREVISNLVDNALKYTVKGGVTIITELCQKNTEKCIQDAHVRITVSDTGIGVPQEEMPYLFQKFSRGKDITRLNTGGTGLGLYVVKIMTEANGGKVWVESDGADRGSRFIVELPIEQTQRNIEMNG